MTNSPLTFFEHTDLPEVDLHHYRSIEEALDACDREVFAMSQAGITHCRVIHGIGSGVLQQAVHASLEKNPQVGEWLCEGGACVVAL